MRTNKPNPRVNRQSIKIWLLESFLEPNKLRDKGHVRVDTGTSLFQVVVPFLISNFFGENLISKDDSRRSAYALHTVHIDFTALSACICYEINCIVEDTRNILSHVVF